MSASREDLERALDACGMSHIGHERHAREFWLRCRLLARLFPGEARAITGAEARGAIGVYCAGVELLTRTGFLRRAGDRFFRELGGRW